MKRPKPRAGKKLPDSFVEGANPPYPERYKKGPETFSGVLRTNGGNRGCVGILYTRFRLQTQEKKRKNFRYVILSKNDFHSHDAGLQRSFFAKTDFGKFIGCSFVLYYENIREGRCSCLSGICSFCGALSPKDL
jgi:hypothetical protein